MSTRWMLGYLDILDKFIQKNPGPTIEDTAHVFGALKQLRVWAEKRESIYSNNLAGLDGVTEVTDEYLEALEDMVYAAPAGPYKTGQFEMMGPTVFLISQEKHHPIIAQLHNAGGRDGEEFFVNSITALPRLIEEVKRLKEELAKK